MALVGASAAGCSGTVSLPVPGPGPEPGPARGVPGFDTRHYPGDDAMAAWRDASPYRWVGFYLPAPCYTGETWIAKRQPLRSRGWGLAVVFVGEQDWPASASPALRAAGDSAGAGLRCTRDNLGSEAGRRDGAAAAAAAAAEGFPAGTTIFLDVERVDSVSSGLAAYVRDWTRAVLEDGRYEPGLYAHAENADALTGVMAAAGARSAGSDGGGPRLWVASTGGFGLRRGPTESGFPGAAIWQGLIDVDESWGGVTLRIDANVADSAHPSGS